MNTLLRHMISNMDSRTDTAGRGETEDEHESEVIPWALLNVQWWMWEVVVAAILNDLYEAWNMKLAQGTSIFLSGVVLGLGN